MIAKTSQSRSANPIFNNAISAPIAPVKKRGIDALVSSTPKILQTSMFVIWGLGLLWVPASIAAIQNQRSSIKTIADDSIPSVMLAQQIVDAMSDIDAMAASELLQEKGQESLIQETVDIKALRLNKDQLSDVQRFNVRRKDVADRLTKAARNITVEDEAPVISQLILNFGDYLAYTERSQAAHMKGDRVTALAQYQLAAKMLDTKLIPKAHELREINRRVLEEAYAQARYRGSSATVFVAGLGLLTIAALVVLQLFLSTRTRRTLNPMLLGATIVAVLYLLHVMASLLSSGEELRVLKEDSYNSLFALRSSRELLYGANSDESRYLLDAPNRAQHEAAFMAKTSQVFGQSNRQDVLATAIANLKAKRRDTTSKGHFATAINNITFPAEREALIKMMEQYQVYMAIDQQIRDLVANQRMPDAIKLCLGDSNVAFDAMKKSMDDAKIVNEKIFDKVKENAYGQLDGFEIKATIALGAMATLVFFGLRPRMREYQ